MSDRPCSGRPLSSAWIAVRRQIDLAVENTATPLRSSASPNTHRLCGLANDVGLLSEEYDPVGQCLLGNFPQAFSHVSLINTALSLSRAS